MQTRIKQTNINLINDDDNDNDVKIDSKKNVFSSYSICLFFQKHAFATSFMFANIFLFITYEKDNEAKKCRTKIDFVFITTANCAKNVFFNEKQKKNRKRRRNHDMKNLNQKNEKRLIKISITNIKNIIQLRIRSSKRLKID